MSATEDDTELRDLLIQNLENTGVLNKLKAEMRAAVFLAMEEQDKLENKTPLINENLKKCLNSKDGRLVASLIMDFLQVFNLDFSLAVFQPEINSMNNLDSREWICRDLGLSESEANRKSPLLLELVRRGRHKPAEGDKSGNILKEPSHKQISLAQKKFDFYDKDGSGSILKEDLKSVFMDLFPSMNKNMLERFISDELRAADKTFCKTIDFHVFEGFYKRLYSQCRSVVVQDCDVVHFPEEKISSPYVSKIPRYKGGQSQSAVKDLEGGTALTKGDLQTLGPRRSHFSDTRTRDQDQDRDQDRDLDLDLEVEEDPDDGDSFFDDPLPKPQKTYGCPTSPERTNKDDVPLREECLPGPAASPMRRGRSLSDLSVLAAAESEAERDDRFSEHSHTSELRKMESPGVRVSPAGSLSDAPRPGGVGGGGGGGGGAGGGAGAGGGSSSNSEQSHSRNGASNSRETGFRDSKVVNEKNGSLHLDEDVEYDDDFNSHRSDLSKSELSIGEEIEEVSIEGPDVSEKFDETTQDLSVSQISHSHGADYMEDVA